MEENLARAVGHAPLVRVKVALRDIDRQFGEHGSGYGHGEDGVGKREPQACVVGDRGARPRHRECRAVHYRGGLKGAEHDNDGGHTNGEGLFDGRVTQIDTPPEANAMAFQRGQLDEHLHGDAKRVAKGKDDEGERGI